MAAVYYLGFTPTQASAAPNVVIVFVDDLGWGDLSCFGGKLAQTENIDRLAAGGIRFEHFYVNAPICSPSRCAITTGCYPQRWRITSYLDSRRLNASRGVADWLDPEAPTLARALASAGYACGHFGKWHLGGQRDVGDAPLITRYGFEESLTNFEGLGARLLPLCDAHDGKTPHPHALGSDLLGHGPVIWRNRAFVTQDFTQSAIQFMKSAVARDTPFYVNLWPDDVHGPYFPPEGSRGNGRIKDLYRGVLEAMDAQLAAVFDFVRSDLSLRNNTLILLCSDNGPVPPAGSAGPLRGAKATLYEGGVRSPLIAWGPGVLDPSAKGRVNRTSVFAAFDLPPTLLAIAGVDADALPNADGESLPGVLLGASDASRRQPLYFRRPPDRDRFRGYRQANLPDLATRAGKWKLLCEYDGERAELYDVTADPGEARNVADDNPNVVNRLKSGLMAWHAGMPPDKGPDFAGTE